MNWNWTGARPSAGGREHGIFCGYATTVTTPLWVAWRTGPGWKQRWSLVVGEWYAFLWGWGKVTCRAQASADLVRLPRHAPHTPHYLLRGRRYLQLLPPRRYLLAKSASPEHQLALSVPPCSCLNTYILRPRAYEKEVHVLPTGKVPTLPKVR